MIQFLHSLKLVYSSSQHRLAQHYFPPLSRIWTLNFYFWSFQSSFCWMWSLFTLSQLSTSSFSNALSWLSLSLPLMNVKMRMVIPQLEKTLMGWATRNFSFFSPFWRIFTRGFPSLDVMTCILFVFAQFHVSSSHFESYIFNQTNSLDPDPTTTRSFATISNFFLSYENFFTSSGQLKNYFQDFPTLTDTQWSDVYELINKIWHVKTFKLTN